jgi:protease-4
MKSFFKNVFSTMIGTLIAVVLSLALVPLFITVVVMAMQGGSAEPIHKDSILHLRMSGRIVERHRPLDFDLLSSANPFAEDDRTIGLYEVTRAIDAAAKDPRIDGIYLELRDLDAGWASVQAIQHHLTEFTKSKKWVYAYGDRFDEKTYFLATAATKIIAQPNGEMEFNGLAVDEAFLKGLFEKLELEPRIFRVGKFKAAIEPLIRDNMSEDNRTQNQELISGIWSVVRKEAARVVKSDDTKIDEIATGLKATSTGQAKDLGLIHELMFEDEVEDLLAKDSVGEDQELRLVTPGHLLKDLPAQGSRKAKKIAIIFAEGEITAGRGGIGEIGAESMREDIVEARDDEDVAAIVLRINSPGGDALASDVLWRELRVADDQLPVVVSMGDVAASGGYYMASAGRHIFAEPTTITGSIGVFGVMFGSEKFFKNKAGVSFDRVVTHPYADIGNPNRPMSQFESTSIQRDVERIYKRFVDVVKESRGYEKREDVESLAEGRVWSGTAAKEVGLVDDFGGLSDAITKAAQLAEIGPDFRIDTYPRRTDSFRELLDRFAGDAIEGWVGPTNAAKLRLFTRTANEATRALPMKNGVYARLPSVIYIH